MGDTSTNQFFFIERFDREADKLLKLIETGIAAGYHRMITRLLESLQMTVNMHSAKDVERWAIKKYALGNCIMYNQDVQELADPIRYQQAIDFLKQVGDLAKELVAIIPFAAYVPEDSQLN